MKPARRISDLIIAAVAGVLGFWFLSAPVYPYSGLAILKYAMAAVLLTFAYKTFQASSKRAAEYVKREDGTSFRIDVSPAATPPAWLPAVLPVFMASVPILEYAIPYLWVMGLVMTGFAALFLLRDPRGRDAAKPRSFRVGPDGIDIDGVMLHKDDIHHMRIKNKFAGDVEIVYDANRGIPTGTVVGLAHRRKVEAVAYRVEVESGGKAHVLAAGLDEVTARGLLAEIGKALNTNATTS
jgi:hypothetical protein